MDATGVMLDLPGAVKWRVYYADGNQVKSLLGRPDLIPLLDRTCVSVDYRTLIHLLTDGWRVD